MNESEPISHHEWFTYWNRYLWQAVAEEDQEAEILATTMLYCKLTPQPQTPQKRHTE